MQLRHNLPNLLANIILLYVSIFKITSNREKMLCSYGHRGRKREGGRWAESYPPSTSNQRGQLPLMCTQDYNILLTEVVIVLICVH